MKSWIRMTAPAVVAVLVATGSWSQDGADPDSPARYFLTEKGVTLYLEGSRTETGVQEDFILTYWNAGTATIEGRHTQRMMILFTWIVDGEEYVAGRMTAFQALDDSVSGTVAMQFYGEDVVVEEYPHLDLTAPLVAGHRWTFPTGMSINDPGLPGSVVMNMESEIVETGMSVKVPAGVFHDCIRVMGRGRSRDDLRLEGGSHHGQSVQVVWEGESIWAPGVGSIREAGRERTMSLRKPVQVLTESDYRSELVKVEKH